MNEMRKLLESIRKSTGNWIPERGDKAMFKGFEVTVAAVDPNDFDQVLIRRGDDEGWVNVDMLEPAVNEADEKAEKSDEINKDVDEYMKKIIDPETYRMINKARVHYPHAGSDFGALLKFIQRSSEHSEEEDRDHVKMMKDQEKRIDSLEQRIKDIESQRSTSSDQ